MKKVISILLLLSFSAFAANNDVPKRLSDKVNAESIKMSQILKMVNNGSESWWESDRGIKLMSDYYLSASNIIEEFENESNGLLNEWNYHHQLAVRDYKECMLIVEVEKECRGYMNNQVRNAAVKLKNIANELSDIVASSINDEIKNMVLFIAPETRSELNNQVEQLRNDIAKRLKDAKKNHDVNTSILKDKILFGY